MPAWIHNRAEHLLAKNPSMKKSTAFAIATQQSHAVGKTPKGYGTSEGKREAKAKYDAPKKEYVKSPNPGDLETPKLSDKPKTRWTGKRLVSTKAAGLLPEFLAKPLRGERLDPSSEDFAKNQAFGRAVGLGTAGGMAGSIVGGALGGIKGGLGRTALGTLAGGALGSIPTVAITYPLALRIQRRLQEERAAKGAGKKMAAMRAELEYLFKEADGDEDEGRAPTGEDKKALKKFVAGMPKGTQDEKFHEFAEGRGLNVHKAEASVYDMLRTELKKASINDPSLLKEVGKPKTRQFGAAPPNPKFHVKQGMAKQAIGLGMPMPKIPKMMGAANKPFLPKGLAGTQMDPRKRFQQSAKVGLQSAFNQNTQGIKFQPLGAKLGFATSQYSGPLGPGRMSYRSPLAMPGPTTVPQAPEFSTAGKHGGPPPPEEKPKLWKHAYFAIDAVGRWQTKQANITTPKSQLTSSAKPGAPKVSAPPGPSIAQVSKPIGWGRPLPGTTKSV